VSGHGGERWPLVAPPGDAAPGPEPSLSVIVAAYQAAAIAPDAVRSALEQSRPALEVVVCDDGSDDDLAGALAPFGDRVTLLRQSNRGCAAARNAAARAARGDYVVVLDADDVFAPERLEALASCLAERPDLDILTTDGWIELDGKRVRRIYDEGYSFEAADQRAAILRGNFIFGLVAVRRELLLAAGGYDEAIRFTEDWDCWVRLILGGARAGMVDAPLATYRLQRGSLSSQRAKLVAGKLQTLGKAAGRADLRPHERAVVEEELAALRARHALLLAREALAAEAPGARRLAARAAMAGGLEPATRLKLAAAVVGPRAVGRRLRSRPVETTAGLLLEPSGAAGAPSGRAGARP
jgi:hypothetical protein